MNLIVLQLPFYFGKLFVMTEVVVKIHSRGRFLFKRSSLILLMFTLGSMLAKSLNLTLKIQNIKLEQQKNQLFLLIL